MILRGEVVRLQLQPGAPPIEAAHHDLPRPRDPAPDVGDAETPLPILDDVGSDRNDLGVDDRDRIRLFLFVVAVAGVEPGDEQTQPFMDLRRCQADAVIFDHRLDHVVDQPLHG